MRPFIARASAGVVTADFLFTRSAVLLQPVTGAVLMRLSTTAGEPRLAASLVRYPIAGLFGVPVVLMQIEIGDLASAAVNGHALMPRYFRAVPPLVRLRLSRLRRGALDPVADDRQAGP